MTSAALWILFVVLIGAALALDLGLKSHRDRHEAITVGEAARWTLFWVGLAFLFAGVVYLAKGPQRSLEFLTGYFVEESLSVDNMFVFILIFQFFKISGAQQPRILKWGILGAVVMRFILIFTGVSLLARFHWIMYVFGALLIFTAIKLLVSSVIFYFKQSEFYARYFVCDCFYCRIRPSGNFGHCLVRTYFLTCSRADYFH